jgi:hypothetical protein
MVAAYGWPIDYVLDLTVPQIRLLLQHKDKRERTQMLWQAQIAAAGMFALSPKEGAAYLESIRELLSDASDGGGWHVPASIPRLEDTATARTPMGRPLPIRVVKIQPEEGEEVSE